MNEKMKRRIKNAERTDHLMTGVFCAVGGSFLLLILVLAGYIIIKGIMSYFPGILAADSGGIGNQLFNTVYLVVLSLLISVPLGVLAGIYMAEYAGDTRATHFIRICIESLSSWHPRSSSQWKGDLRWKPQVHLPSDSILLLSSG